ncbi:LysR family transcriptional regulator [Acinetobacter guillouiae]
MSNYFELIKIFCTVANTENFKKAAVKLGKSPQSITRAIQELED